MQQLPPFNQGQPPPVPQKKKPWYRSPLECGILIIGILTICLIIVGCGGSAQPPTFISSTPIPTQKPAPTRTTQQNTHPISIPTIQLTHSTPTPLPTHAVVHPTPKPTANLVKPTPTQAPIKPTPTYCVGINNNPWCYNFTLGNKIYSPPSTFCSYFTCVSTFWTANHGYVAECANGSYTHSGGVTGACSRDGGVAQTLYSH